MIEKREIIVYNIFYISFLLYCKDKCLSTCLDHIKTFFNTLYGPIFNISYIANCYYIVVKDFFKIFNKFFFLYDQDHILLSHEPTKDQCTRYKE